MASLNSLQKCLCVLGSKLGEILGALENSSSTVAPSCYCWTHTDENDVETTGTFVGYATVLGDGSMGDWKVVSGVAPPADAIVRCCVDEAIDRMIGDEDDECPCAEWAACLLFDGFDQQQQDADYTGDLYQTGSFDAIVNGDATSTPWSYAEGATDGKSNLYTATTDAINAVAGWSIEVDTDIPLDMQGKTKWKLSYSGPKNPPPLVVERTSQTVGDKLTAIVTDDGAIEVRFEDAAGDAIPSFIHSGCDGTTVTDVSGV